MSDNRRGNRFVLESRAKTVRETYIKYYHAGCVTRSASAHGGGGGGYKTYAKLETSKHGGGGDDDDYDLCILHIDDFGDKSNIIMLACRSFYVILCRCCRYMKSKQKFVRVWCRYARGVCTRCTIRFGTPSRTVRPADTFSGARAWSTAESMDPFSFRYCRSSILYRTVLRRRRRKRGVEGGRDL